MGGPVPNSFWDIALAEEWNTTPWDVRKNATGYDIGRKNLWDGAKKSSSKMDALRLKAERQHARHGTQR